MNSKETDVGGVSWKRSLRPRFGCISFLAGVALGETRLRAKEKEPGRLQPDPQVSGA